MSKAKKKCAECGGRRKQPVSFKYVSRSAWEQDDYCSRECCEKAHGLR